MVWRRDLDGLTFTFHLAGINNQNFLMRDEQTGTYWQQINGVAVSGPLAGKRLTLVPADELTFGLWKSEQPHGTVLQDVAQYAPEYSKKDWDVRMKKVRTVISYAEPGVGARDLMLGIAAFGAARAFPIERVLAQKLVKDHVGTEPILLVTGPDGQSVRAFRDRIPGVNGAPDFYRMDNASETELLMDAATGSKWNFRGCATSGRSKGVCLERIEVVKDYWFDWRNYHADTTVYHLRR